jgi:hypothetical protein
MLERDPVITGPKRGLIIRCLPKPADIERLVLNSNSYRILLQAVDSLDQEYLRLWIDLINTKGEATDIGNANLNVDLCGTLIGSHLRSSGLSEAWIINHLQYELKRKQSASSMINVLEVADRIIRNGEGPYSFLVPLRESAHINSKVGMPRLSGKDFTARFSELFPGHSVPEHRGGLQIDISALEKYVAQDSAAKKISQAGTRVALSSNRRKLVHANEAWMHPGSVKVTLDTGPRTGFRIPALDAEGGRLLFQPLPDEIEGALDLMTGMATNSDRASCVGAWSALESLLADPGDFGNLSEISERAADILVCCYVADMFLALAVGMTRRPSGQLASNLSGKTISEQIGIIENHLSSGASISTGDGMSAVVASRVGYLVGQSSAIDELHSNISAAFRRLYQVRNAIVHSDILNPYGIDMILPAAHVLLSRLINKVIVTSRESGDAAGLLAAKAHWSLQRVRDGQSMSLLGGV